MASKLLRFAVYGTITTASAAYTISSLFEKEFNTLGIVRFGRAAFYVKIQILHYFLLLI